MPISSPPPADPALSGGALSSRGNGALSHPLPAGMRDLLPDEARGQLRLVRQILETFERFGYEPVSVPPFEYADVLEHDMGPLDPAQVLRFVEPETGEVVALRPDMTPQIARLVAMRLPDAPLPVRLCYEGAVVRRRVERARRERQIHQAGFELVGRRGIEGDLEVLAVASSAVRATGLQDFTLDVGHARVAASLVEAAPPEARARVMEALAAKDVEETRRRAEAAKIRGRELEALEALPSLCGGREVFGRAERVLGGTRAEAPAAELRELCERVDQAGLAPNLVVDLGETWSFAYYTGMAFHVLADGPGEALGSGGRYDRLFDRFGAPRAAAGFAIDVGNLAWALARLGRGPARPVRVLVTARSGDAAEVEAALSELRAAGLCAAPGPSGDVEAYARAFRYSHHVELSGAGATLLDVEAKSRAPVLGRTPRDLARATSALIRPEPRKNEEL